MGPLRGQIVFFVFFTVYSKYIRAQNVGAPGQRQQVTISSSADAYSQSQSSAAPQLMNTLLTVASANGVLPEILNSVPSLRQDARPSYNVIPANAVNIGPLLGTSSPLPQQNTNYQPSSNYQTAPVLRLNPNPSPSNAQGRNNLPQQQIYNNNFNVNRIPPNSVAKINPLIVDKSFGIPMNLEITLPPVSLGVEVPEIPVQSPPQPPPPPPPPAAPIPPIPTPTFVPISCPLGNVGCGSNSRLKSIMPLIFLSLLNNGRCGGCGGYSGGCGGGCGGGCSSCNAIPVPYPIPIPVFSPIVVRCDDCDCDDDDID